MRINNRLYTYPILCAEKQDFINSVFDVEFHEKIVGINQLNLELKIKMNNDEINRLIRDGKACYIIHLECSTTAFRTVIKSQVPNFSFDLSLQKLRGKLEMIALIALERDIFNYRSNDFDEDFDNMTFDLKKGNILGYVNLPSLDISKNYEEFANLGSIFKIHKILTEEKKPMDVRLESEYIILNLGTAEYNMYNKYSKNKEMLPILISLVILPALVYVFEELKQENSDSIYSEYLWFQSLEIAYKKRGLSIEDDLINSDKTSLVLAQEAMELPLSYSFEYFDKIFETDNEEG